MKFGAVPVGPCCQVAGEFWLGFIFKMDDRVVGQNDGNGQLMDREHEHGRVIEILQFYSLFEQAAAELKNSFGIAQSLHEIGRASCRERVYVSVLVASLKMES